MIGGSGTGIALNDFPTLSPATIRGTSFIKLAPDNPLLRRVPHPELTAHHIGGGNDLKIIHRHEVPDFQLSLAHDCQGRRLYPANPDHAPGPSAQNNGRGSGQRQVVDLVGLTARYGSGV